VKGKNSGGRCNWHPRKRVSEAVQDLEYQSNSSALISEIQAIRVPKLLNTDKTDQADLNGFN
jgi:hypothetical protein